MGLYVFLGCEGTGKSFCMLMLAKLFALLKKNVLVIDTTQTQGVHNYFNYNMDIEEENALSELKPIIRENFSILCNNPLSHIDINYYLLNDYNTNEYDYVFVEGDVAINKDFLNKAKKIFFFHTPDKDKIIRNKYILQHCEIDKSKLYFILNQMMEGKNYRSYIYSTILEKESNTALMLNNEDIEIPFSEEDVMVSMANKMDGVIRIKDFSQEYKNSIYEFANLIQEISNKEYKKALANKGA